MSRMFDDCSSLVSLDLSTWDVANVEDISGMFHLCTKLESIKTGPYWVLRKVKDASAAFMICEKLRRIDVAAWPAGSLEECPWMFYGCGSLEELDLSSMKGENVKDIRSMFGGCAKLRALHLSGWKTDKVTDMSELFKGCRSLQTLDLAGWLVSKDAKTEAMFEGLPQTLRVITGDMTIVNLLPEGIVNDFSSEGWYFDGESGRLTISGDLGEDKNPFKALADKVRSVTALKGARVRNGSNLFCDMKNLARADLSELDVSECKDLYYMFSHCESLVSLDLSTWDIKNAESMRGLFSYCEILESIKTGPKWIPEKATDVSWIFYGCTRLQKAEISAWPSDALEKCDFMFGQCSSLEELDLSSMDVSNVKIFNYMFSGCTSLRKLDLSGWNTQNVTEMRGLFAECTHLETLDLTGWHIGDDTDTTAIVKDVPHSLDLTADDDSALRQHPAARQEQIAALIRLGNVSLYGNGTELDWERACPYYENAAKYGYYELSEPQRELLIRRLMDFGTRFLDKKNTDTPNPYDRANELFEMAVKITEYAGIGEQQFNIGITYYKKDAVPDNKAIAAKWFNRSAKNDCTEAQYNLGVMYYKGEGGLPVKKTRARELFQKAADQGVAAAQFALGAMYYRGEGGLSLNKSKAKELFQKAADQGNEKAKKYLNTAF